MKSNKIFTVGKKYSYIGNNFKKWFYDMKIDKNAVKLESKVLVRWMTDFEIQKEFKPSEVTLKDIDTLLDTLDHTIWNIFYVKDRTGVLQAVDVYWNGVGWYVDSYSVEDPFGWSEGDRVFSCNFLDTQTTDSLTLSSLDTLVIEIGGKRYKLIQE